MNRPHVRRNVMLLGAGVLALVLLACGDGDGDAPATWDGRSVQTTTEGLPFVPSVINSSLGVGEARVMLALIDREDGSLVSDASIDATFYRLADDPEAEPTIAEELNTAAFIARSLDLDVGQPQGARPAAPAHRPISFVPPAGEASRASPHDGHDHDTTVYTTNVTFDRSGHWGIALRIEQGGQTYNARLRIMVLDGTPEPPVGAPAPRSEQMTLRDVDDITEVSSAITPIPAMLEKTVAEALDTGRPVVVAFVTPAFCQTRYCGPVMDAVLEPAWERYGDRVEFVHIEPFNLEVARTQGQLEPVPAVREWGLRTEPYIFVVDAEGLIRHKLEGITDLVELSEAIESVLR